MKIICIGNYPPRKCGIATFTENLVKSILTAAEIQVQDLEFEVIAMNDRGQEYDYPPIVTHSMKDRERADYENMAKYINNSGAEICLLEHEYGIYGGESGLLILSLLRKLKMPIISTFHTVLEKPAFHQKEVLKKIGEYSSRIVVMSSLAIEFLTDVFEFPREKIVRIEHGVPDFIKLKDTVISKPKSWENRQVMLTFGLIGRSKGIETVLKALPGIVKNHPDVLYVVLGKTHPHVLMHAGEEYRNYLINLTHELGLENHVEFLDQYVQEHELMEYLLAADIYVTPYLNKAQITSGTLAYAVGGGSAVISTPYWHAEELLAEGRGLLFNFNDYEALTKIVNELLNSPDELNLLKKMAFDYGLNIAWPKIGAQYLAVFKEVIDEDKAGSIIRPLPFSFKMPEFRADHLQRLTDDTGLIQHAKASVPNYKTGYCVDDNTRAILVCLMAYRKNKDEQYLKNLYRYLSFLLYMQNRDGSFKNNLTYWKNTVEEVGSDDAFGRAMWSLGYLVRYAPNDSLFQIARELFYISTQQISELRHARGYANCILGLYHYIKRYPDQENYVKMLEMLADRQCQKYHDFDNPEWHWFEKTITYDNGILPMALFLAYEIIEKPKYLQIAQESSSFLEKKCFKNGYLTLVGNGKWPSFIEPGSDFGQQPIDAATMVLMYSTIYKNTPDENTLEKLRLSFEWFFGNNDLNLPLYDDETHGCNDGLEEFAINRNQGAESVLAYLLAWLTAEPYIQNQNTINATL